MICIDARHVKAALSMQINKVTVTMLNSRALLVKMKRDLENQIRGLLKNVGLVIGRSKGLAYRVRVEELLMQQPELGCVLRPLLKAREGIEQQFILVDRLVKELARQHATTCRFMTVPGVGPITALAYMAGIDDPARFRRSRIVGAYCARRHASGEID